MEATMEEMVMQFAAGSDIGKIDRSAGVIFGVSVITEGEAKGHGMFIDGTMLNQVEAAGRAAEPDGIKSRFDHPGLFGRTVGTAIGRFHNFRRDGDRVRADLHIFKAAAKSPDGDLRDFILSMADEDPNAFGMSIAFRMAEPEEGEDGMIFARLEQLNAIDLVDTPAANKGLFKDGQKEEGTLRRLVARLAALCDRSETQEKNMADATLQESLEAAQAEVVELNAKVEEMQAAAASEKEEAAKVAFDEGVAAGDEQAMGRIAGRMERYKDASFVMETVSLSDDEVKDKWIEKLEAQNKAADAALSDAVDGDGSDGVDSQPSGDDPDADGDDTRSLSERRQERADELKAEGLSAEKAWSQAHSEIAE